MTAGQIKQVAAADPEQAYLKAGYTGDFKKRGSKLVGLCPFHAETVPSFKITLTGEHTGAWFCHGACKEGGDIIAFYEKLHGCDFKQAADNLARLLGITNTNIVAHSKPPPEPRPQKVEAKPIPEEIMEGFCQALRDHPDVQQHLQEHRLLSEATIERARLGYDSRTHRVAVPVYDADGLLRDIRLIAMDPEMAERYGKIFPYLTEAEREENKTGNGPGSNGRGVPRLYDPFHRLEEDGELVITEGEWDCLVLNRLGISAITNTCGAGNIPGDLWGIEGRIIYLIGDADKAGENHNKAWTEALIKEGAAEVRVWEWETAPVGYDVSDFLTPLPPSSVDEVTDAFREFMAQAKVIFRASEVPKEVPPVEASQTSETAQAPRLRLTDTGNSERLVAEHGQNIRYCQPWKKWLAWTGKVWCEGAEAEVMHLAKQTVRQMYEEAGKLADDDLRQKLAKHALSSESAHRRRAMVFLAESEPVVACDHTNFDLDPYLLNCENGTLDLRTGTLQPHSREDYLTKIAPVAFDSDATCAKWLAFLDDIFDGNTNLTQFIQRAVGYSLTGDVSEDALFFAHGEGSNGKTTFLLSAQGLLGPYAAEVSPGLLLTRRYEAHPTALADLFSIRLAVSEEVGEGRRFDEERLRYITGGSPIKARRMREDFWEFSPTHKIWLAANEKPRITGQDYAIWRRIKLIPFNVKFTDPDQPGPDKDISLRKNLFRDERAGILTWALEGCLSWQSEGLDPPAEVKDATAEYKQEEDVVQHFIESECIIDPNLRVNPTDLHKAYEKWRKETGATKLTPHAFGRRLTEKGFTSDLSRNGTTVGRWRSGVGLKIQPQIDYSE